MASAKYGITYATTGQASGEITFNDLANRLEQAAGLVVKSIGDTSPPGSPADGDAYILGSSPTGDWSAFAEHDIAYYYSGWYAITLGTGAEGVRAHVQDVDEDYLWSGTAWVAQQGALTGVLPVTSISNTYTTLSTDRVIIVTGSATFTLTLIAAASFTGRELLIISNGTAVVTVDGNASETIDGATTQTMDVQYEKVRLFSDGTEWFILSRDGAV